jgi:hypothetical protein
MSGRTKMRSTKKKRLESSGWKVGSAREFLGLSPGEETCIESKLGLAEDPGCGETNMSGYDDLHQAIAKIAGDLQQLHQQAADQFKPVVDDILRTRSRNIRHIEHTLDFLLGFCGYEPVLIMFKQLCRHYWDIDPAAAAFYVNAYRECWDNDKQRGQP